MNSPQKFDWQSVLQLSFLPIYQAQPTAKKNWLTTGYDFVFNFPQATLVLLVNEKTVKSPTVEIEKSVLRKTKQKAVSQLVKKHQKRYKRHLLAQKKANQNVSDDTALAQHVEDSHPIYFVGVTLITVMHEHIPYPIPHSYGGLYFQEECVIDLDEEVQALQVFSLHSLLKIMELLNTPSDFLAYLDHHRRATSEPKPFTSEVSLMETFMHSSEFFTRSIQLQQQLVQMGVLNYIDVPLQQIQDKSISDSLLQFLLDKMQEYSAIWKELVQAWINKCKQANKDVALDTIQLLLMPSTYLRMEFLEVLLLHGDSTEQLKQEGYIYQPVHYSDFGCHYIMVIYGSNPHSKFSKEAIAKQSDELLRNMNVKLPDTVTTDLVLLGFEMNQEATSGDFDVSMDVFHYHLMH